MRGRDGVVVGTDGVIETGCAIGGKEGIARNQIDDQGRGGESMLASIVHQRNVSGL